MDMMDRPNLVTDTTFIHVSYMRQEHKDLSAARSLPGRPGFHRLVGGKLPLPGLLVMSKVFTPEVTTVMPAVMPAVEVDIVMTPVMVMDGLRDYVVMVNMDRDGHGVRYWDWLGDGDMVLLGVDNDRGLFPFNGQGDGQGQGDGKDPLLRLEVLE
jgi:hypothetical protein